MPVKTIYLIRGSKNESYPAFRERIFKKAGEVISVRQPSATWVTLTAEKPPRCTIIPFKKTKIAAISVLSATREVYPEFTGTPGFTGVYLAEEAIPKRYEKTWPDGTPTPGVNLLTLFHQKPGISREQFLNRWHHSHTPLSLRIHPLWNYNRNVITEKLTDDSAPFDGIVEEQMKTREDLLNPFRFFGNPLVILYRMLQVYLDTNAFLDYRKIETYLAEETHIN